jgi:hypothetical protein
MRNALHQKKRNASTTITLLIHLLNLMKWIKHGSIGKVGGKSLNN